MQAGIPKQPRIHQERSLCLQCALCRCELDIPWEGLFPQHSLREQLECWSRCCLGTLKSLAALWALCNAGRGNCASACPCSHLPVLCLSPGEEAAVWQCLTLLEEGLSHSPSNAQFKLLLIRIYCRLGAFEPVSELYSSLDAKHIQHDTIGWVVHTENNHSLLLAPSWQLQHPLPPRFQHIVTFLCAVVQKCSGVFGRHVHCMLPLSLGYLPPCYFWAVLDYFRVLIGEMAGWLPVRAWCASLGTPVKASTPWCDWGSLTEQFLHP